MSASAPSLNEAAASRQEALRWFVRRQDASWSDADERDFQEWLASSPMHDDLFAQCATRWQRFDGMPPDLLARMQRRLGEDQEALQAPAKRERRRFFRPALALGAAFAAGGAGYVVWQQLLAQPELAQSFATGRGQQKAVDLPDGSQLLLDTATRLEVRYFRDRREVQLIEGQAVFAVHPDAARPFDVRAGALRVTVIGTRFAVRHTPDLPGHRGVSVAVEEGKVRVARAIGVIDSEVYLVAGHRISSDPMGVLGPIFPVSADGIAPWRRQLISFVDVRLDDALAEIARYGDPRLIVRDANVAALRLSGTFDPLNHATLRLALARVLPVRLVDRGADSEVMPAD